uniref:Peptide TtAP-2 n=1 Tax=Tityus trinitatis TaxID=288786 RepID=NDB42_TITTI|nr:RecName: Full=Peptide TtAP-2 [Tityus trinitatis]
IFGMIPGLIGGLISAFK